MRFTKSQVQILVALHLIIVVLFACIFGLPTFTRANNTDPTDSTPTDSAHDKNRLPRVAFSENLFWETNIGGKGDETVLNAFSIFDSTYIIGTTTSTNLDFNENAAIKNDGDTSTYLTKLNPNGTIGFSKFYSGTALFSMLHPSGNFIIIQREDNQTLLYNVDTNGETTKTVDLALSETETVLDGVLDSNNRLNLVMSVTQSLPPLTSLKILTLNTNLEPDSGAVIEQSQDLNYIAAYPHNKGIIIAANVSGQTSSGMMLFNYNNGTKLLTTHNLFQSDKNYTTKTLLPYKNGYAALIVDNQSTAYILTIDYETLEDSSLILLKATVTDTAFYTNNSYYYVFLKLTSGGALLKKYDSNLVFLNNIDSFESFDRLDSFTFYKNDSYFGGSQLNSLILSIVNVQGKYETLFQTAFATSNEQIKRILPFDDYTLIICESTQKSLDVGNNFGKKDIWIAKARF